jgi:hypothetical protein
LANFNQNPISGSAFLDPVGKVVAQRAAGTNILVQLSGSFLDVVPIGSGAANDPIGSGAANDPIGSGAANDPIGSEKPNSLDGDGELNNPIVGVATVSMFLLIFRILESGEPRILETGEVRILE